ncbi:MAG TPA: DinB family protein [Gemmatimonadaceae bacterium]|nr:DinB family protein [Gemmatimonadaceae bacterium]
MLRSFVILIAAAAPLAAQTQQSANLNVSNSQALYLSGHNYLVRAAEQMPDSLYNFKPTADVRSFGALIGHVAGAERMFCAMATGQQMTAEDNIEKTQTTKAGLVAALKASGDYCAKAYAMSDADAAAPLNVFGQAKNKGYALTMNATHVWEHYGNVVTYMRLKGQTPPSSQR